MDVLFLTSNCLVELQAFPTKMASLLWLLCYFSLFNNLHPCAAKDPKGEILPKEITLEIPFNNSFTLTLLLKEKEGEISESDVIVSDVKGGMTVTHTEEHTARYVSDAYKALFTVSVKEGGASFTYMGSFYFEGKEYNLVPVSYNETSLGERVAEEREVEVGGSRYNLVTLKAQEALNFAGDEATAPGEGTNLQEVSQKMEKKQNGGRRGGEARISRQSRGRQDLLVELLVVIDHSTYQKFLEFSKGNDATAISQIKYYYTHLFNGVNDNYQRINHASFKISMVVVALYIAKLPQDAPFTTARDVAAGPNLIYTYTSLSVFYHWIEDEVASKRHNWPRVDIAVMFHEQASAENILGLGYIKTVCTGFATAMVKNLPTHENIFVTTHEIGHVMGSWHDSENNDCSPHDSYIMTTASFGGTTEYHNEQTFSECSVAQFETHINDLNKANNNCMLDRPSNGHTSVLDSKENSKVEMGQRYSLQEQCKITHGRESYFCGGEISGDELCSDLVCYDPARKECDLYYRLRAYEGTSCGDKMWCRWGKCLKDSKAPSFTVTPCMYGDSKAFLAHHNVVNLTCPQIFANMSSLCYQEFYSKPCCDTCAKIKKRNPENCWYGDKDSKCNEQYCYHASYRENCCETCGKVNNKGCYGSGPSWCSKKTAFDCYSPIIAKSCCQKCESFKVSNTPGCEYGDKAVWCEAEVKKDKSSCDDQLIKETCCHSCR